MSFFFRFPIINLFTVEVSSNCNTLKNKKKVPPISKVPHSKTWHYQNGNKAVKCIHMCAWGTTDLVKLNCMPFHPAVNYSITTHTCLSLLCIIDSHGHLVTRDTQVFSLTPLTFRCWSHSISLMLVQVITRFTVSVTFKVISGEEY